MSTESPINIRIFSSIVTMGMLDPVSPQGGFSDLPFYLSNVCNVQAPLLKENRVLQLSTTEQNVRLHFCQSLHHG